MIKKYIKENKTEFISVLCITLFALVLRIISLKNFGEIWYDELYSWHFAHRVSAWAVVHQVFTQDIVMPLYFVILHFWIKIFGDNIDTMRWCSFLLSAPLIPLSYIVTKKLFNKTSAYFASIFLALSTFCVYYSLEIRFYCIALVLSTLVSYFYVRLIEDFDKKSSICFIVCSTLLVYTFSGTPLLLVIYFVLGLVYLSFEKPDKMIDFAKVNLAIFVCALPVAIFTIINMKAMNSALTFYPKDTFPYEIGMVYDMLENFFSFENFQLIMNSYVKYRDMFENIHYPIYFWFVFIPIVLALLGIIRAIFSLNKRLYLFIVPSLVYIVSMIFLAHEGLAVFQTRYMIITFVPVIITLSYGFSIFKNQIAAFCLFIVFLCLNLFGVLFKTNSIYNLNRWGTMIMRAISNEDIKVKDTDILLIPASGDKLLYFVQRGKYIPFCIDDAVMLKDKKSLEFYFGADYKNLKRDNVRKYLLEDRLNDRVQASYEKNLYEKYIKPLHQGDRIVFLNYSDPSSSFDPYRDYRNENLTVFIFDKVLRDTYLILNKYLKLTQTIEQRQHSFYVFEKE